MELRARISPIARRAAFTAALAAVLVPTLAGTATADAAKKKRYPVVRSVSPMNADVGETITLRGRNFIRGKNKNTVVFKRDGSRAVFMKSTLATAKQIRVVVPDTLREFLPNYTTARFRLRVLSKRFSKRFTTSTRSPMITALPKPVAGTPGTPGSPGTPGPIKEVCTGDADGDLLDVGLENALGLDGCKADSDGDGATDGYEYRSAQDLNDDEHQDPNNFLPYPGKRPYPNPLDDDAGVDHDGDTLTLVEEYQLWRFTIGSRAPASGDLTPPTYSAGEQYSVSVRGGDGRRRPDLRADGYPKQLDFLSWAAGAGYDQVALSPLPSEWYEEQAEWYEARSMYDIRDFNRSGGPAGTTPFAAADAAETTYYDYDNDGWLSDAERDEDADGLTNFDETRGCGARSYWDALYNKETPYYLSYGALRHDDPDSDGDGVRDGADDQDHDDIPNMMECSRNMASGDPEEPRPPLGDPATHPAKSFVNPFNPCLPHYKSRTCNRFPSLASPWAPFNADDVYFYIWN